MNGNNTCSATGSSNPEPEKPSCCSQPQQEPTSCCNQVSTCTDQYAGIRMIPECLEYAKRAKENGRPVIGIMCEYAPREIINAIGGVAVCLCGGSQKTAETAEVELSAGICPLIKSTYGYMLEGSNPFLEMADLIVAETTCDGKKKVFELMGKKKECYTLELPQKTGTDKSRQAWLDECREFSEFLSARFNVETTDCKLEQAIKDMNYERKLRLKLAKLMSRSAPPFTGRELLGYNSMISPLPWALQRYEKALENKKNISECSGIHNKKRVLLTGVPIVHGAERIMDLIEENGGLVIAQENCTGIKPITELVREDTGDPLKAIAEKYIELPCSVLTPNTGRTNLLEELIREYSPECIIDLSWRGCHTFDIESIHIKKLATQFALPYLKIQTDYTSSDCGALTTRLQALFEIC